MKASLDAEIQQLQKLRQDLEVGENDETITVPTDSTTEAKAKEVELAIKE